MNGTSRAGREKSFLRVLMQQSRRNDDPWMTTGKVCRRLGLKSSTRFKAMLFDMAMNIDGVMWREDRGKREYAYIRPKQLPLSDRYIVINKQSCRVADWVYDNRMAAN